MKKEMIKRTFQVYGENKTSIWVAIPAKIGGILEACLPKNEVNVSNRIYGWGGSKTADIELPKTLVNLFKPAK